MTDREGKPIPLDHGDVVVRWKNCPDCEGRGYFLINPFATGGSNGAGGLGNMTQCQRCVDAHEHYKRTGKEPAH